MDKSRVLIIDDSALVRRTIAELVDSQPDMEVMGMAADPYVAVSKIKCAIPDVITLDIEMPRMDGLTFLKKIMSQFPIPVIIVSSLAQKGSRHAFKALQCGAVGVFNKDDFRVVSEQKERLQELVSLIRMAPTARISRLKEAHIPGKPKTQAPLTVSNENVIVLGASTGGTVALKELLSAMPANSPGMVVVQHMPKSFTGLFADELNRHCALQVKEAKNCEYIEPGKVLLAPGDKHIVIRPKGNDIVVCLSNREKVNNHRPSVDILFQSAALHLGPQAIGVLLTGMGNDGAMGLKMIQDNKGYTIVQDEATSVVYGMPKKAVELGAAREILPLSRIAPRLVRLIDKGK